MFGDVSPGSRPFQHTRDDSSLTPLEIAVVPIRDLSSDALLALNRALALDLDLADLHAIAERFSGLHRDPTDVELSTIARLWNDRSARHVFSSPITVSDDVALTPLFDRLCDAVAQIDAPFVRCALDDEIGVVTFHRDVTLAMHTVPSQHQSVAPTSHAVRTALRTAVHRVMSSRHQPIAIADVVCGGRADRPRRAVPDGVTHPRLNDQGVIDTIADVGSAIGVPIVAGAVVIDSGFSARPVVHVGCVGVAPNTNVRAHPRPNDLVVLMSDPDRRGDLLEVMNHHHSLYSMIVECSAATVAIAVCTAARGIGADVDVLRANLDATDLHPHRPEVDETHERLLLAVPSDQWDAVQALCDQYGFSAAPIGSFTDDTMVRVRAAGRTLLELDSSAILEARPHRPMIATPPRPHRNSSAVPADFTPSDTLLLLLAHPTIASKELVVRNYDYEVRGATLVRPIGGAASDAHDDGVVIAEPTDHHGVAIGVGVNPWFGMLDPERMAYAAVDEAIRNVVAAGADPALVALTASFSWGDTRRHTTMGDLMAAVDGCRAAAIDYKAPIVSSSEVLAADHHGTDPNRPLVTPSLAITAVAHVPDAERVCTPQLTTAGHLLVMVGHTANEFGGSHYALVKGTPLALSGSVPAPDLTAPDRYHRLHLAIRAGIVRACHDVSEGGLAVAIAEMCISGRMGARIERLPHPDTTVALFSESLGRFVCEVAPADLGRFTAALGDPVTVLGEVTATRVLSLPGVALRVDELVAAFREGDAQ